MKRKDIIAKCQPMCNIKEVEALYDKPKISKREKRLIESYMVLYTIMLEYKRLFNNEHDLPPCRKS